MANKYNGQTNNRGGTDNTMAKQIIEDTDNTMAKQIIEEGQTIQWPRK